MRCSDAFSFTRHLAVGAASVAIFAASVSATVIYETDFVTQFGNGNPFNAANLQFQDGWLGQNFTEVDPSGSGTANTAMTSVFPRNLNNRGALGNLAGGDGSGESSGPGFNVGDKIRVTAETSFVLDGRFNRQLAQFGVDNAFVTGGFNPNPVIGMELHYSEFQSSTGGSFKLFGNFARNGNAGADNAFALIVDGLDIGLDPDGVAGPADLESDLLEVSIEMQYLGADQWLTTALTLNNSTTATPLRDAATDQPSILTEVQTVPSSNDLFVAVQWMRQPITSSTVDSIRYEYFAVPEPASLVLLVGAVVCGLSRRRA